MGGKGGLGQRREFWGVGAGGNNHWEGRKKGREGEGGRSSYGWDARAMEALATSAQRVSFYQKSMLCSQVASLLISDCIAAQAGHIPTQSAANPARPPTAQ